MQPPDDTPRERPSWDVDDREDDELPPKYLFPVDGDHPEKVLPLVCDLIAEADGELLIGSPVVVPDHPSLEDPDPRRDGERLAAKYVLEAKQHCESNPPISHAIVSGHSRDAIVRTMVETYDVSTFITQDRPRSGIRSLLGLQTVDEAAIPGRCDSIIVTRIEWMDDVGSILVPIASGPHSELAIETGLALARQNDASLELLHSYTTGDAEERAEGEKVLSRGAEIIDGYEPAEQTLLETDGIHESIIEYADPFDITVFGAPREGLLQQFMLGTIPGEVSESATGTVLIVHRGGVDESWLDKFH